MKRVVTATLLALLLAVILLAGFFPASWAWNLVQDRVAGVHLGSVHGSVWNGRADDVVYAGLPLGSVHWTLSRTALFGHPDLHVHVHGRLMHGSGEILRRGDMLAGRQLHFTVDAGQVPVSVGSPGLRPRGEMVFDIDRVEIRGDWPRMLHGRIVWRHAALEGGQGPIPLGELRAQLHERAGSILEAQLSDTGGPLGLSGTVQASTLGWRIDADLRARSGDPALRQALAQLGRLDGDGTLHLRRQGGLMMGAQP
jgi:general secretion pathway protein N